MTLDSIAHKRKLAEADLLTGAESLALFASSGLPKILHGECEQPKAVLLRLCDTVEPADLTAGAAALWRAAAARWGQGRAASLEGALSHVPDHDHAIASSALAFARYHGMGLAYTAPVAARRILAVSAAMQTLREARLIEAAALDEASRALDGVV